MGQLGPLLVVILLLVPQDDASFYLVETDEDARPPKSPAPARRSRPAAPVKKMKKGNF
jgi:hypothetical protein